ncbi:hypothetical protein EP7_004834 [Isosphaeraceae bacterium EP7]
MGTIEVSQRRIDANRRNALRSTGPRTAEGKAKSRRNGLIHGLAGSGVVVHPDSEGKAAQERAEQWNSSLRPMNAFEMGLVETIAVESLRIERCRIEERLARDTRSRRAVTCWGDERKAAVERIARGMARRPAETAAILSSSAPGCDWQIDRWRALGHALDKGADWSDDQHTLALDLLGLAHELRDLPNPTDAPDGDDPIAHRQDLVDDQLERLLARKDENLDEIDEDEREAAIQGLSTLDDPRLVLLRRYETASFRRLRWALDLMHRGRSRSQQPVPREVWDPPAYKAPIPSHQDFRDRPGRDHDGGIDRGNGHGNGGGHGGGGIGAGRTHSAPDRTHFEGANASQARPIQVGPSLVDALGSVQNQPVRADGPLARATSSGPAGLRSPGETRIEDRAGRLRRARRAAAMRQLVSA